MESTLIFCSGDVWTLAILGLFAGKIGCVDPYFTPQKTPIGSYAAEGILFLYNLGLDVVAMRWILFKNISQTTGNPRKMWYNV